MTPAAFTAIFAIERYVRNSGLDPALLHLIKLRASYMNGCAYCVDMHTTDARHDGETEQRLYAVPLWRETRTSLRKPVRTSATPNWST